MPDLKLQTVEELKQSKEARIKRIREHREEISRLQFQVKLINKYLKQKEN